MKLVSAIKKYSALNAAQKEFIKNGRRIFLMKPDELIRFISPLAAFDADCDRARTHCGWAMALSAIFLIVALIASGNRVEIPFIGAISGFFGVLFVVFLGFYLYMRSINIHNNLRDFIVPVVNTIGQDMAPNAKMKLKVDLRGGTIPEKQTRVLGGDNGWFASYPRITITYYKDPWIEGTAEMFDGSIVTFSVVDTIVSKTVVKKNFRGKVKTKHKSKTKHQIRVSVALKNKSYSAPEASVLGRAGDRVKQKAGEKRNVVALTRVERSSGGEESLDSSSVLAMLGRILMSVRPAADGGKA